MPFKEMSKVNSRLEFVIRAIAESANISELCRRHGLPEAITTDNGPPWDVPASKEIYTSLGVWLIRRGV